ncbi:hypothetical protein ABZX85_04350 [Streptomyces sp. NPDC004539]|uniref:hypothetical protein n=1 Tax=Streptomyces sp. NPDC004539 TaxID=3154280 RepID=UPI0033B286A5
MRERPDLSVPQVAGSALAAVLAAKLASSFGVYGTILGAGVVSVIATCGGSLFQHFFKRTGEQLREATVPAGAEQAPAPGEYSAGTVHRARGRGLRRPVVAAVLVFGVTMTGITAYELASGSSFSGGGGTTVSDAVSDSGRSSGDSRSTTPENTPSPGSSDASDSSGSADSSQGEATPSPSAPEATPSPSPTAGADEATPAPSPSATAPEPSADSRSGTADPGPTGPAAR